MNYPKALGMVLEFVERYNKKDEEKDVAEAAEILRELIQECGHVCTSNCRREGCNCECGEYHGYQQEQFSAIKR